MSDSDLAAGVSSTALMVAAARAIETHHPHSLLRDEYAEHFVRSASSPVALPTRISDVPLGDADPFWGHLGRFFAVRARTFDDFLIDSAPHTPQLVILGAGLDTRALRLPLPPSATCYEIDRPDVLAFKTKVLDSLGALSPVPHHLLTADLADDWPSVLLAAGFDPAVPTTWIAEGLLLYLPAPVETTLITTLNTLSAPGSRVGLETLPGQDSLRDHTLFDTSTSETGSHLGSLFDPDPRPDTPGALRASGWTLTTSPVDVFSRRYGRGPDPSIPGPILQSRFTFGEKDS
ncbi:SAM-dependent methyltransferase [Amycolatopsis sp. NPDC001319]|uniref:SAM-dependent methyltransferase n=1 Tax=unclassified Amycolatopsis TaxID=2618356 RepID=UPI0036C221A9